MLPTFSQGPQKLVLSLVDHGATLKDVERRLEGISALDEDDRAALWLLAWSHRDRGPGTESRPTAGTFG